jgi:hypothetical protein
MTRESQRRCAFCFSPPLSPDFGIACDVRSGAQQIETPQHGRDACLQIQTVLTQRSSADRSTKTATSVELKARPLGRTGRFPKEIFQAL